MGNIKNYLGIAGGCLLALASCAGNKTASRTVSGLDPAAFDTTLNGKKVELITLKNNNGMEVCLTNYGGRVVSLCVPDKEGKPTDVVLGYDNIRQYADTLNSPSDYGSSVGRYANRIKNAQITVGGKVYKLRVNDNENTLHGGGNTGWLHQIYNVQAKTDSSVTFAITAPDGENGFPGTVKATATYLVKNNNTLDITFKATTDKETVINMTNHSYFNLNGDPSKVGTDEIMYINADKFTPSDAKYIPTGEIRDVTGTPMDFRKPHAIQETITDTTFDQIHNATGYDHNWCLNTFKNGKGDDTQVAASLFSPKICLKCLPMSRDYKSTPVISRVQAFLANTVSNIPNMSVSALKVRNTLTALQKLSKRRKAGRSPIPISNQGRLTTVTSYINFL